MNDDVMNSIHISTDEACLSRRKFLRGMGVSLLRYRRLNA